MKTIPASERNDPEASMSRHRLPPLRMDPEAFREAGRELVDAIADFLSGLPNRPVNRNESADDVRAAFDAIARLPEEGADARTIIRSATDLLFEHSLFNGHPRFFGYVTPRLLQSGC